jgi:hypothetical protein
MSPQDQQECAAAIVAVLISVAMKKSSADTYSDSKL